MYINIASWMILGAALAMAVLVMAGYRKIVRMGEDKALHLGNPSESAHQVVISHKLEHIDKWGKLLRVKLRCAPPTAMWKRPSTGP